MTLHTCSYCSKEWGAGRYDSKQLSNYQQKRLKKLICEVCAATEDKDDKSNIVYQRTMPELTCHMHSDAGIQLSRNQFSRTTLKNASTKSFHCCINCQQRRDQLQQQVCGTKIKCDCPQGLHQATRKICPIFYDNLSQQWPGKDCHQERNPFTWDDVEFLHRLPTVPIYSWWHKLWGRLCTKNNAAD